MANSADPDQLKPTVCNGKVDPGSAGHGLKAFNDNSGQRQAAVVIIILGKIIQVVKLTSSDFSTCKLSIKVSKNLGLIYTVFDLITTLCTQVFHNYWANLW